MKFILVVATSLLSFTLNAQADSLRKPSKLRFGVYSSASYQFAVNGNKAQTNLRNFAFKGYLQPEIGLGIKYEQDSSEFAFVSVSTSQLAFTLASKNILEDASATYEIFNRFDIYMNKIALELSYHKRIAQIDQRYSFSLECGVGIHYFNVYNTLKSDDTLVGPYTVSSQLILDKTKYFLPSAEIGISMLVRPVLYKAQVMVGIRAQLYLDNFPQVSYSSHYLNALTLYDYDFRWSPVLMEPKIYAAVMF